MKHTESASLLKRASAVIPGGVNSPVRAFQAVEGDPPFIVRGAGARIWDEDGNPYLDYVGSWGPLILGHAHESVIEAVVAAAKDGTSFGAPTRREVELAELICKAVPSIECVRMVNSGTEATMSALRLARAATERDLIIKFAGCYHGHTDSLLVQAGSGAATLGVPTSPGVPKSVAATTLVAEYNDADSVEALLDAHRDQVAAIIVEPVAGNMGVVPPAEGFLARLRALADAHGALLIYDEVMTGFRVAWGGYQVLASDVTPDLTCLGKVIGGGLPAAAYGGRADLMSRIAPAGPVYQAGTLSGNPLAMAAGLATLRVLSIPGTYDALEQSSAALQAGLEAAIQETGVAAHTQRVGSMLTLFFSDAPVVDWPTADACRRADFGRFHRQMLDGGVHLPPAQFEAWFVSTAHDSDSIDQTVAMARTALERLQATS